MAGEPEALWVEWPGGVRCGLPGPGARAGLAAASRPAEAAPEEPGGQVIDRAVLAERRARRAEAAEREQARVAAEALKAVEALELQSAELERRLAEAVAERDALADARAGRASARASPADAVPGRRRARPRRPGAAGRCAVRRGARPARGAAPGRARERAGLAGPAARAVARVAARRCARARSARSGDAVRLAVLEAERALGDASARAAR